MFLAGFALTVTPGKLGEAVKAVLLRASHRIAMAKTAPIVIAERVTDLVALLLLALVGVFKYDVDPRFLIAGAVLVVAGLVVVSVDPVAKAAIRDRGAAAAAAAVRAPHSTTLTPTPRSCSRRGRWSSPRRWRRFLVLRVPGVLGRRRTASRTRSIGLRGATFVYAATTIAGALSFLPGGLGVTEAGMLALLAAGAVPYRERHRGGGDVRHPGRRRCGSRSRSGCRRCCSTRGANT